MKKTLLIAALALGFTSLNAQSYELWGLTQQSGTSNIGTIYKTDSAGENHTIVHSFTDGEYPSGSLLRYSNGELYGVTAFGGVNDHGIIFSIDPTTEVFTKHGDLSSTSGGHSRGSFMLASNGMMYLTTYDGGANGEGTIIEFNPSTNTFTKVHDFGATSSSPSQPLAGEFIEPTTGKLYGMTRYGGQNGDGVIYEYDLNTQTVTTLFDFQAASTGEQPFNSLLEVSNGLLYGLTSDGGSGGYGTLFAYDVAMDTFEVQESFSTTLGVGVSPTGALIEANDGLLYGVTDPNGHLFSFDVTSKTITGLQSTNNCRGTLLQASNDNLYGVRYTGQVFQYEIGPANYSIQSAAGNYGLYGHLTEVSLNSSCTVNIPDANFKAYLVGNSAINTNSDGEIQCSEAQAYTGSIVCNSLNIVDLTGIEAFVNLTTLHVYYNNALTTIDLSQNTALTELHIYRNALTSLDVSNNTALVELRCERNPIMSLDVTMLPNLEMLTCGNNGLTTLDVSNNLSLEHLELGSTPSYGNVNQLTSLDVTNNSLLTILHASQNLLTTIDLSNNNLLEYLNVTFNGLNSLNVSNLVNLEFLYCEANNLTSLDLSNNLDLSKALFGRNPIVGTYDFSSYSSLSGVTCDDTQITELNLANGNNTNFSIMLASETPNLNCIEVDDSTWSANNWNAWNSIDSDDYFSVDCDGSGGSIGVDEIDADGIKVYPNPLEGDVFTVMSSEPVEQVLIHNLLGELVLSANSNEVNTSEIGAGSYLVTIQTKQSRVTTKLIKR